jgi:Fimbrial assembly protein (PilN)
MLRSNLSTRPFYNERAVHLLLVLGAVLVLAFTFFNVTRIVSLSRENTDLVVRAGDEEGRARQLRTAAERTRQSLDPKVIDAVSASAREANAIIDRRLFSWTALFNYLETTLPDDVRITSVRPQTEGGNVRVLFTVIGRRAEDVDRFMDALEATRAFKDVLSIDERTLEDGNLLTVLEGQYLPAEGIPAAAGQPGTQPLEETPPSEPRGGGPTMQQNEGGAERGAGPPASDAPRGDGGPTIQK